MLGALTASSGLLGVWAVAGPRSFYDSFPNGRGWVAADGPYNEHLVRDFGGLNLALAVIGAVAVVKFTPLLVRTAAAAMLAFGVPHLLYHATHLDVYEGFDLVANVASLSASVVLAVAVLALAGRLGPSANEARA